MNDLFRAAPYVKLHRGRTMVIKVGGAPLSRPHWMHQLARQISVIHSLGARVVLLHGGGPQTDTLQKTLGEEPRRIEGRRVTSELALRALRMATSGDLNGLLTSALNAQGAPAVGLCAASADIVVAKRRPPMETSAGTIDFGLVGDPARADARPLRVLLDAGYIPVVAPPVSDGAGGFLNVNADLLAACLATALEASKLIMATGAEGILRDPNDAHSVVSTLSVAELDGLAACGALRDGMRVKATAIRSALLAGVPRVHVVSGTEPDALLRELYTTQGCGTLVTLEPEKVPGEMIEAGAWQA
ncbi:MAG: acetylglutamate kinase [Planctomycetes bacterium]|nr:acetylglutamate kinase [Planctomycetota bacterium]